MTSVCSDSPLPFGIPARPDAPARPPAPGRRRSRSPGTALPMALVTALLAALVTALLPAPSVAQPAEVHMEGAYGLWVQRAEGEAEGRLEARWFTRTTTPGFLEAWRSDSLLHRTETRRSFMHSADFPAPAEGEILLRYGAAEDAGDRHETPLRLPLDRPRPPVDLPAVDSLYVMGDVHGQFDRLLGVLRAAGLVDGEERWAGGSAHLVLLGDLFDRGPDVTRALWFLYRLEAEARDAGGAVHVVLGNHEIMVLTRDLRYVSPKERSLAEYRSTSYTRLFDLRRSVLGQWLASKPALLRIGPVLLAHGGLSPRYASYSLQALDDSLAAYMDGDVFHRWSDSTVEVAPVDSAALERRIDFFFGEESVFWYRSYVEGASGLSYGTSGAPPADSLADLLGGVLDRHGSRLHVVAHTPLPRIQQAFGGRLIGVDLQQAASEILLLVRDGEACRRYRIDEEGNATRLGPGGAAAP